MLEAFCVISFQESQRVASVATRDLGEVGVVFQGHEIMQSETVCVLPAQSLGLTRELQLRRSDI
jgi:hypothetical protein